MKIPFGLIILVGCILIGIFIMSDYVIPQVICKIVPKGDVKLYPGQYNPNVFGDMCSQIT